MGILDGEWIERYWDRGSQCGYQGIYPYFGINAVVDLRTKARGNEAFCFNSPFQILELDYLIVTSNEKFHEDLINVPRSVLRDPNVEHCVRSDGTCYWSNEGCSVCLRKEFGLPSQ